MPQIKIREVDTTTVGASNSVTNTVYIPGYANIGPLNVPTLCGTLADFQRIFGAQPYHYSENWTYASLGYEDSENKTFVRKGDYEKSYLMAVGLLNLGMPVIFERCYAFNGAGKEEEQLAALSYTFTSDALGGSGENSVFLQSVEAGEAGSGISASISSERVTGENDTDYILFTLTVSRAANDYLGLPEVASTNTVFAISGQNIPSTVTLLSQLEGQTDTSGLVIFKAKGDISEIAPGEIILTETAFETVPPTTPMEFNLTSFYQQLATRFNSELAAGQNPLMDRGEYVFKFLTAGGYPTFGPLADKGNNPLTYSMAKMAAARGDLIALTDYAELYGDHTNMSLFNAVTELCSKSLTENAWSYAAMFAPYAIYYSGNVDANVVLPASYGYLASLASSIQNNPDWLAIAGVTRGIVPNLIALNERMPAAIADAYQPRNGVSINTITDVKPYGLRIWGNRTLKDNKVAGDLVATSFLNIRHLANDIKRIVYVTSKRCTFEQNNDILWVNYKAQIIPTLDQMTTGGGLSGYKITRQATDKRATLKAKITLYAIEAVEDFDITIELADGVTAISE